MPTMKRFLGGLSRRPSSLSPSDSRSVNNDGPERTDNSSEETLAREIKTFVESSNSPESRGNEFVHLPRIVELAESNPGAAKEAAVYIRKYLSTPSSSPSHVQYNAIMLMRILIDNPGDSFTRNIDSKFTGNVKDLLRYGRDYYVQNYLRQYLTQLETTHGSDEHLIPLIRMWQTEKTKGQKSFLTPSPLQINRFPQASDNPQHQQRGNSQSPSRSRPRPRDLPEASELAARLEEARNSAKLLTQFVQTTTAAEMENNELIKEFTDRCRTSSRLIHGYIDATNPSPDEDTLLTLIETNDEITVALSQQQRALLRARKARGGAMPNISSVATSPASDPDSAAPLAAGAYSGSSYPEESVSPVSTMGSLNDRAPTQSIQRKPLTEINETATEGRGNASQARYEPVEYNSADFAVQNPFADDYEEHEEIPYKPTEVGRIGAQRSR
ncbi:hypothetical protein N7468_002363, partial [Penicillium chermesinum]